MKLRRLVGMGEKVFVSVPREAVKHFIGRGLSIGGGSRGRRRERRNENAIMVRRRDATGKSEGGSLDAGGLTRNIRRSRQPSEA
ncbi:hypothetical protein STHU_11560 [Allostella humosa]|nr:hypothetical protein STHU_11560 [Stella humosa]